MISQEEYRDRTKAFKEVWESRKPIYPCYICAVCYIERVETDGKEIEKPEDVPEGRQWSCNGSAEYLICDECQAEKEAREATGNDGDGEN